MALYLNTNMLYENYQELCNELYFVDKSAMIEKLNARIRTTSKYVCVTRPRRFGKSKVVDMLGAYYSKAVEASNLFDKLQIADSANYKQHMNQYNVIYISFNRIPDGDFTYNDYIGLIRETLVDDLKMKYPNLEFKNHYSLRDMLHATQDKFIFLFDEWDYIFNKQLFEEHQNDFLEFLRNLLKDQSYVALAYMTGVLPIKRYSSGSALNMFDEFTMLNDMIFGEYFGFTEEEVQKLCEKQEGVNFELLKEWYNGYLNEEGSRLYNPRSVVKALQNKRCKSYWTNTGAMEEVVQYLRYNTLEVRDDVIEMVSGAEIDVYIDEEFRAGQAIPKTREEIYSAMIVLGFLSYHDGYLKIPNKELMKEFEKALKDKSFGYVNEIIHNSRKMLKATIQKDTQTIEQILHEIHNSEIPILQYNDENSLSCVVTLAYLAARDYYRVEREEKKGKGYADFTFYPMRKKDTAFIVELKKDETPEVALSQIKEKEFAQKMLKEYENILAVAICYDSKEKVHRCKIEDIYPKKCCGK